MRLNPIACVACLILICASTPATAEFEHVSSSAFSWEGIFAGGRLSALGNSDLADDSPAALLLNPAPLAQGDGIELSYDNAGYAADVQYHTFAGALEWQALRVNAAVLDLDIPPRPVHSAYNPEAVGTLDIDNRMSLVGVSYDLGQGALEVPNLQWSVGAVWRHFYLSFEDSTKVSYDADAVDLGTTLGWQSRYDGGRIGVTGAIAWQNITETTLTQDSRESALPQPLRFGLTLESAWNRPGRPDELVTILLAYARTVNREDDWREDSDHVGAELRFLEAVALRWGYTDRVNGGITSLGIGVVLDERVLGPLTIHADLGQMRYDNIVTQDDEMIWGVRARYAF